MQPQLYSVNQHLIETLLVWVKSGEIAIPKIQRMILRSGFAQSIRESRLDGTLPESLFVR